MNSAICTLFENHYHYGVGALVNSLYSNGFSGDFYAGYRGDLPFWAVNIELNPLLGWKGAETLIVNSRIRIHFLPIASDYHLTNFKSKFLISLFDGPAKLCDSIFYFDPDIVIKCRWSFFEEWVSNGVALVHEIVHNDMPKTHPIRIKWEKIIIDNTLFLRRDLQSYINGGFCGISNHHRNFLSIWNKMIDIGINQYNADPNKFVSFDRTHPFWSIDQDAINIAAMCCESPISEMGPDGMDFIGAGWLMSHATGNPKPWDKKFIYSAIFKAVPPSLADKVFWKYVNGPIVLFSFFHFRLKRISILIASFIGRFYRQS